MFGPESETPITLPASRFTLTDGELHETFTESSLLKDFFYIPLGEGAAHTAATD